MWKQMRDDDFDQIAIKIVIVGNGVVGKSSMIQRYCNGMFSTEYKKTIGVDFLERLIQVNSTEVRLMLWDTAGQEEFDALTKAYYRGAQGCVVAFSTTDKDSFDSIEKWKKKVEYECGDIPMVLVQNKSDLLESRAITTDQVDRISRRLQLKLFMTSAKNNVNIDEDPLFGGQLPKKFQKKNKNKAIKSGQQFSPFKAPLDHGFPTGGHFGANNPLVAASGSSMAAPLLHHFRYERQFQFIPGHGRQDGGKQSTIFLHQQPWQPYYAGNMGHRNVRPQQPLPTGRKRNMCWIL
ncbi:Ras-related protein Rab-23 [Halotydeus destructor]|nr:Ras-related protein Rab-23 [Halotydeus destructor]